MPLLGSLAEVAMDTAAPTRLSLPASSDAGAGEAPVSAQTPAQAPPSQLRAALSLRAGDALLELLEKHGALLSEDAWRRLSDRVLLPLSESASTAVLLPRLIKVHASCAASCASLPDVLARLSSSAVSLASAAAEAANAGTSSEMRHKGLAGVLERSQSGVASFGSLASACAACGATDAQWSSIVSAASSVAGGLAAGGGGSDAAGAEAALWRARVITALHTTAGASLPTSAARSLLEHLGRARATAADALRADGDGDSARLTWTSVLNEVDTSRIGCLERWCTSEASRSVSGPVLDEAQHGLAGALLEAIRAARAEVATAGEPHAAVATYAVHVLADASRCADGPFEHVLVDAYRSLVELGGITEEKELRSAVSRFLLSDRVVKRVVGG